MTAQFGERLIYEGEERSMTSLPLGIYFVLSGTSPEFAPFLTACWRGYLGTWEILDDRLYLVKLKGRLKDMSDISLETFFPGFPERVFAHWYSGTVHVRQGKMLEYVHQGFFSTFEETLLITIVNGVVTNKDVEKNTVVQHGEQPRKRKRAFWSAS